MATNTRASAASLRRARGDLALASRPHEPQGAGIEGHEERGQAEQQAEAHSRELGGAGRTHGEANHRHPRRAHALDTACEGDDGEEVEEGDTEVRADDGAVGQQVGIEGAQEEGEEGGGLAVVPPREERTPPRAAPSPGRGWAAVPRTAAARRRSSDRGTASRTPRAALRSTRSPTGPTSRRAGAGEGPPVGARAADGRGSSGGRRGSG